MSGDFKTDVLSEAQSDCKTIWPILSLYADSEASDFEKLQVEMHLRHCESCAEELTWLRSAAGILTQTPEVSPPLYLRERILAATVNKQTFGNWLLEKLRSTVQLRPARYSAAAAAAVLLITAIVVERPSKVATTRIVAGPSTSIADLPKAISPQTGERDSVVALPATAPEQSAKRAAPPSNQPRLEVARLTVPPRPPVVVYQPRPEVKKPASADASKRSLGSAPAYKAKPAVVEPEVDDPSPDAVDSKEPVNVPVAGGMVTADIKTPASPLATPETPARMPAVSHIQLSASSADIPSDQTVTLAGLKQALKQQSMGWNLSEARQNLKDKQIRLDLLKRSF